MAAEVTLATFEDVVELAAAVREPDRKEIWRSSAVSPEGALRRALRVSDVVWTGRYDGEMVCMFGVAPVSILTGIGSPWMVGTDLIEKHARPFLRANKTYIEDMLRRYPVLMNYADTENVVAVRWLEWLGFKMSPPKPYGPFGFLFHRFEMRR